MNVKTICQAAMIAAVYVVISLMFLPISFGPIQCRISEMLTVLPAFIPAAVPGVAIGCLITNILGGAIIPDIIFGTLATLIGAVFTRLLTSRLILEHHNGSAVSDGAIHPGLMFRLMAVLPPVISNTVIVPLVLKYAYMYDDALLFMAFTVAVGEILSAGILGNLLISVLCRGRIYSAVNSAFQSH